MSTIDEIMGAIGRHGDDCIRDADVASESFEALREMIAAALEDARRDGAEAMRGACEEFVRPAQPRDWEDHRISEDHDLADAIRALPLPTGERQAVLLTSAELLLASGRVTPLTFFAERTYRAIEAAALAKNNLEVRRG